MASTDINNLKKRLKRSVKPAEETPAAPAPEVPHKELVAFLGLLLEKNYFQKPLEETGEVFGPASTLAPLDKAIQEVKAAKDSSIYLDEIFAAYNYLRGFRPVPSHPSFFLAALALWTAADTPDRMTALVRDITAFPHLETALNKAPQLFHFENDLVVTAVIQAYNAGSTHDQAGPEVQLTLAAAKVTKNKPIFFLKLQPKSRNLDGFVFSRVLFGLSDSQLPSADSAAIERLIQLSWLAHRGCRRSSLKLLASYYQGLDPASPLTQKDTPLAREVASVLYFNKMSHKFYEDDDLTAVFGDFWSAFGSSNVKTLLLQSLPDVRRKYIRLFGHALEDVSAHPESLEAQADNHLFQRCIFLAVWELQIRMEPASAPTIEVDELLDFLGKVLAVNTKQLDWTYTTPKIKQILLRLAAKEDFQVSGDHLQRLLEGLISASAAFPADIKTKALREVAREFGQEKHGHVYGKAVVKIYERDATKLPLFPLLFALEVSMETDPSKSEVESLVREALGGLADPSEDLVKQLTEYGDFDSLKALVADQIVQKAESLAALLADDQKKELVNSLVRFTHTFLSPKLHEAPADDSAQGQAAAALRALLPPPPEPTETAPEEGDIATPALQAD